MELRDIILSNLDKYHQWIVDVRRELHKIPEIGFDLPKTTEFVMKKLEEMNIEYKKNIGKSGIVGDIYGKDKNITIALRADMDALPMQEDETVSYCSTIKGHMHACGHDAHTAILLGVAKILTDNLDKLPCNVRLIFQPAEETTGGALPMIMDGCLEGVDAIFGLHVDSAIPFGKIGIKYGASCASSTGVIIKVHGKSCHGAYPSMGIDAIATACSIVTSLQSIISRNIDGRDSAVLSFGVIKGGDKENIISDYVEVRGTLRTLSNSIKEEIKERIKTMVNSIATGYGARGEVELIDGYIALINHDKYVKMVQDISTEYFGKESVIEKFLPNMGVEDFAYYVDKVPGVFFNLGVGNAEKGITAPLHNNAFNIDEDSLLLGAKYQLLNVITAYEDLKK